MLRFVIGRAGSGKTEELRRWIARETPPRGGRRVMIVPEQYSFETEKAMLNLCDPVQANQIEIYSFTRLAEAVFRVEGGIAGNRLSEGGRRVMMSCALAECEDELEVYRNAVSSGRMTDLMLTAVSEMKLCGISPQRLMQTAAKFYGKGLGKKLSEIALLYETYNALVERSYLDSRDELTRLTLCLQQSEFFRDAIVAVDSFEGFTVQEIAVLAQIFRKASEVRVSLCTDGEGTDENGLFALVDRTRQRLIRAAEEENVPLGQDIRLEEPRRFENDALKLIEKQLFCAKKTETAQECEGVTIFQARDVYEETEYVAATIRRLTDEQGLRYRDFSIICRQPEQYFLSLDTALKKRDIPCFVSRPTQVDAEPVSRFVLSAFAVVQGGFRTDDILELLKTGVSGFTAEEISELENYAFLWRINGSGWKEEWNRHPRGFGQETTEEDVAQLQWLNHQRMRVIDPLVRFAQNTADHTGMEISQAVFDLMVHFGLEETLPQYCAALERAGEAALAARQVRVWELLMDLLNQFYNILGDRHVSRERYYFLLKEVLAAENISEIPQTVDEVLFGTAEQVRQSSPRVVFLLGVTQGDFPLNPRSSGVFSDAERRALIEEDLMLGDPLKEKTIEERYLAYSVACAASQQLYVCWPRVAGGEEKEPSEVVSAIRAVFPNLTPLHDLDEEYFCNTREAAFSRMAAHFTEDTAQAAALRALFDGEDRYAGRIEALRRAAGQRPAQINERELADRLFGEQPFLSPTQIETYQKCPFQYFCRYGLKANERRTAEVDALQYGSLMHYLMEKSFGGKWSEEDWSEENLPERVAQLVRQYADEMLGGFARLSKREQYRLQRLEQGGCKLLLHVREELAQSKFQPKYYELHLGQKIQYPPLRIPDGEGGTVVVSGTIDRADIYVDDAGQEFVRVIDYKTGHKKFQLNDVLYGLNMQMLVYLAAMIEQGRNLPAGILYLPAVEPTITVERGTPENELRSKVKNELKMSGLVLSDQEIIRAMEELAQGKYIPASIKKPAKGKEEEPSAAGNAVDAEDMKTVLEYSKRLIATMGQKLHRGIVAAKPNMINANSCEYCPYRVVCGSERDDRDVISEKLSNDEVIEKMKGGENHEMDR